MESNLKIELGVAGYVKYDESRIGENASFTIGSKSGFKSKRINAGVDV
jgi:hypothetical protein